MSADNLIKMIRYCIKIQCLRLMAVHNQALGSNDKKNIAKKSDEVLAGIDTTDRSKLANIYVKLFNDINCEYEKIKHDDAGKNIINFEKNNNIIHIMNGKSYRNLDKFAVTNDEVPNFLKRALNFLLYFVCYPFLDDTARKTKRHSLHVNKSGLFKSAHNDENSMTLATVIDIAMLANDNQQVNNLKK